MPSTMKEFTNILAIDPSTEVTGAAVIRMGDETALVCATSVAISDGSWAGTPGITT